MIIINEPKLKQYFLIPYSELECDSAYDGVFCAEGYTDKEHYMALVIQEVEEGFMVDSVTSDEVEIHPGEYLSPYVENTIFFFPIKDKEDIHLHFTFKKGYPLYIYDEADDLTYLSFHEPGEMIYFDNEGTNKNRIVSSIEVTEGDKSILDVSDLSYYGDSVERNVFLRMPNQGVKISIRYHADKSLNTIRFDLSGIKDYSYESLPWANSNFYNYFTLALYSDDYDCGLRDEDLEDNKNYYVQKNDVFKLIFNFIKEVKEIKIFINGKEVEHSFSKEVNLVTGYDYFNDDKEHNDTVYQYECELSVTEDGVISFEVVL